MEEVSLVAPSEESEGQGTSFCGSVEEQQASSADLLRTKLGWSLDGEKRAGKYVHIQIIPRVLKCIFHGSHGAGNKEQCTGSLWWSLGANRSINGVPQTSKIHCVTEGWSDHSITMIWSWQRSQSTGTLFFFGKCLTVNIMECSSTH